MTAPNNRFWRGFYFVMLLLMATTLIYVSCQIESQEERIQQLEQTLQSVRSYSDSTAYNNDSLHVSVESEWRGVEEYSIN